MEKERLKMLAEDPRFIQSIYNYCDRWCERCPEPPIGQTPPHQEQNSNSVR